MLPASLSSRGHADKRTQYLHVLRSIEGHHDRACTCIGLGRDPVLRAKGRKEHLSVKAAQCTVAAFQRHAGERLAGEQLVPSLTIDLELPLETVDARLFLELSRFGPYGPGNPEPTLALRSVAARGYPRIVGENHLKMVVARNGRTLDTIGFNLGHLLGELNLNRGPMTIVCRLRENVYLGRSTLQGRLIDVRLEDGPD